jgi:hypothetical protein
VPEYRQHHRRFVMVESAPMEARKPTCRALSTEQVIDSTLEIILHAVWFGEVTVFLGAYYAVSTLPRCRSRVKLAHGLPRPFKRRWRFRRFKQSGEGTAFRRFARAGIAAAQFGIQLENDGQLARAWTHNAQPAKAEWMQAGRRPGNWRQACRSVSRPADIA